MIQYIGTFIIKRPRLIQGSKNTFRNAEDHSLSDRLSGERLRQIHQCELIPSLGLKVYSGVTLCKTSDARAGLGPERINRVGAPVNRAFDYTFFPFIFTFT
jgi:hypothetical protein